MTLAEMTESQFRLELASATARSGEPAQDAIRESAYFPAKDMLDRALGLFLLVPALPVIGLLVLLVRWTSRGPGVFRQVRVGKGGRIFTMYKLRSMRMDAEARTGPTWSATAADPRVTRLGYWLRVLHLDELPQLLNVVRGEMSLVGPRPERPEFVSVLAEQIPGYLNRLVVKPGVTGLAQINLPADTDLDSVRRKLVLDCEYVATANTLLDLRILACTALRMLGLRGGRAVRLLGLTRTVDLPPGAASIGGDGTLATTSLDTIARHCCEQQPEGLFSRPLAQVSPERSLATKRDAGRLSD
jgi:lipopolysaccharide/colanic/teichoic acid biosynthesis glycosyltransferase